MRIFTFSEFWGPFLCESAGCENSAFAVILTDEENASLPEDSGPETAAFILKKSLGKAACDECLKTVSS